jgi:DNA gyrase subunit A
MSADIVPGERIQDLDVATELRQSYLRYAMSVIVDRALPDIRDGLKPSQRRILVAMNDLGLSPNRKTLKCAKVVGETMGNYHPHGDQAIYPTLVRLAQDFNMRETLIQGQGNFGSVDGDPPASMRYTECRMTPAAVDLLEDLDKDTVDFQPNYDESRVEPTVLPGRFPNLLVNGGSGIAVAMASSIPPHNAREVAAAVVAWLRKPDIDTAGLMEHLPGPDFPTGARICGGRAIREAYETGRGVLEVRAKCEVTEGARGAPEIVVTEIPFQVNKSALLKKIGDLVKSDRIPSISEIRDESDEEVRIVIRLKKGEDPEVALNQLYKFTPLRDSFSVIMIALVEGRPVLCPLKRMIEEFVAHRKVVITRRTRYLLRKAEERDHIVVGLLKAIEVIDEVVALIRRAADPKEAKAGLVARFDFSTVQAEAILQMRLQRLTGLQRQELEAEHADLQGKIEEYRAILSDERFVLQIVEADMLELMERYPSERRTTIEGEQSSLEARDLVAPENVVVTLSHEGYVKRTSLDEYRRQRRGGKGIIGAEAKEGDFPEHLVVANTHDWVLFFTDQGRVFKEQVYNLPEMGRYAKGRAIVNILNLAAREGQGEKVTAVLPLRNLEDDRSVLFVTRRGTVKRTRLVEFRNIHSGGIIAISLHEGDSLIGAALVRPEQEAILITALGRAVRFRLNQVREMGRPAAGVIGARLRAEDRVVGMEVVDDAATLLTVCERGYAKRSAFADYPTKGRGTQGVQNLSPGGLERNGPVVAARRVMDGDEVILITEGGQTIRMEVTPEQFRILGRSTSGVRGIEVPEGDRLVSMALVRAEAEAEAQADDLSARPAAAPGEAGEPDFEVETSPEEGVPDEGDEGDGEDAE